MKRFVAGRISRLIAATTELYRKYCLIENQGEKILITWLGSSLKRATVAVKAGQMTSSRDAGNETFHRVPKLTI